MYRFNDRKHCILPHPATSCYHSVCFDLIYWYILKFSCFEFGETCVRKDNSDAFEDLY